MRVLISFPQNGLKKAYRGYKYKPLDLRVKKTRAIRRRLTVRTHSLLLSLTAIAGQRESIPNATRL
jgi:hypothetical protein